MGNDNQSRVATISAILRDEILRGQYRPGERLPSERDLATRFEANRGAIREALKKLEQLGIARIRPGGVRVVPLEDASLSILSPLLDLNERPDANLLGHLLDVFGLLVSMLARTAIERATDSEIVRMQEIVNQMLSSVDNQENWKELGTLFAQISNNLVLRLILNGLRAQFLERKDRPTSANLVLDQTKSQAILLRLGESIEERDSNGITHAILDHFEMVKQSVQIMLRAAESIPVTAPANMPLGTSATDTASRQHAGSHRNE